MNSLFILFLPSILGLKIINHLNQDKKNKELIIYFLLLVLFSNIVCIGSVVFLNNFDGNLLLYFEEHLKFSFKYMLLSVVINIVLSFVFSLLIKNFSIKLEVKNENKKNN